MIYEVKGDILLTKAQAIVHGVAPNDPMNQGLALQIHEKYPTMHKDFHHWCHQYHPKSGEVWMWGGVGGVRIVNVLTQEGGYGKGARPEKATYSNVNRGMRALKKLVEKENLKSIAIPKLATGVGGLVWEEVLPIIENHLDDLEIPIYVYSDFVPHQQAVEP